MCMGVEPAGKNDASDMMHCGVVPKECLHASELAATLCCCPFLQAEAGPIAMGLSMYLRHEPASPVQQGIIEQTMYGTL